MAFNIGLSKKDKRIAHWEDIQNRITTHEGEFLSGKQGEEYRKKWSEKMLGKDLNRPLNVNSAEAQKELAK